MKTPEKLADELATESARFHRAFARARRALAAAERHRQRCRRIEKRIGDALDLIDEERQRKREERRLRRLALAPIDEPTRRFLADEPQADDF